MILKLFVNDDTEPVQVAKEDMLMSTLIRTVVEGLDNDEEVEIPLPNVSKAILLKIIEFTRHYTMEPMQTIPRPLPYASMHEIVGDWYGEYITNLEETTLYDLIRASNYMDMDILQDLACARVAMIIRGKEPNEIRQILGLEEDLRT